MNISAPVAIISGGILGWILSNQAVGLAQIEY